MTATATPTFDELTGHCVCNDPAVDILRDLIAQGLDQWSASLIAFEQTPQWDDPPLVWKAWCQREVRKLANDLRRRLGLPEVNA